MSDVRFESHADDVINFVNARIRVAAEIIGGKAESYAKQNITQQRAVDTGLLRNSITHGIAGKRPSISEYKATKGRGAGTYVGTIPQDDTDKTDIVIGTNVRYAPFVELGTIKMKARPYLRPAIENNITEYKEIIEDALSE